MTNASIKKWNSNFDLGEKMESFLKTSLSLWWKTSWKRLLASTSYSTHMKNTDTQLTFFAIHSKPFMAWRSYYITSGTDTFIDNLGIKHIFTKYLKESYQAGYDEQFFFKYFQRMFCLKGVHYRKFAHCLPSPRLHLCSLAGAGTLGLCRASGSSSSLGNAASGRPGRSGCYVY